MVEATQVKPQMEVVGADGVHVGIVDHMDGDRVKLTKRDDAHGIRADHHHYIPLPDIASHDGGKLWLSANAADAKILMQEKDGSAVEGFNRSRSPFGGPVSVRRALLVPTKRRVN